MYLWDHTHCNIDHIVFSCTTDPPSSPTFISPKPSPNEFKVAVMTVASRFWLLLVASRQTNRIKEELFLKKIYLFIFGCTGSSLLHTGLFKLLQVGATLRCRAQASDCGGFSCCRAWALGTWDLVV